MAGAILLLEASEGNKRLFVQQLQKEGYDVLACADEKELGTALKKTMPGLAVIDLTGQGPWVWPLCEDLRRMEVPFIVISSSHEARRRSEVMESGASKILTKPLALKQFLTMIKVLMEEKE